jgi:hypothetical protein
MQWTHEKFLAVSILRVVPIAAAALQDFEQQLVSKTALFSSQCVSLVNSLAKRLSLLSISLPWFNKIDLGPQD